MSNSVLPTFFLCGAPKAGTTSLYEYCAEHPAVCMSRPKETGFFFEDYGRGIDWFSESYFSHYQGEEAIGEASAGNMMHQEVAPRIREHCPGARLVFVLRDPVERVWSHYRFDINVGFLPPTTDFSELIRDESSRWREIMVELGMYRNQLENYAEYFEHEQMQVFLFREFVEDTDRVVRHLFEFIGVDPEAEVNTGEVHNETSQLKSATLYRLLYQAWHPLKKTLPERALEALFGIRSSIRSLFFASGTQEAPSMKDTDRQHLGEIYNQPNARLEEWLERDLSHWT